MRYNVSGLDMKGLKLAFVEHFFINIILFEFCKKKKIFPKKEENVDKKKRKEKAMHCVFLHMGYIVFVSSQCGCIHTIHSLVLVMVVVVMPIRTIFRLVLM